MSFPSAPHEGLIDANLSPVVAQQLRHEGFNASHVADHGLARASDEQIAELASSMSAMIVSADSDFATILARSDKTTPSLVLFRSADALTPTQQAALLRANCRLP